VRLDIQVLRAFAVGTVVVYHLLPRELRGGFVGVDIFFAISGFLITTHLIEAAPRSLTDLLAFWGRRIRRLLPASITVLLATTFASWLLLDPTRWGSAIQQIRAAVLYVLNWRLAADAVDYLKAGEAGTPVQHYWSLAVEEQFYIVWPILILLLGLLAAVLHTRRRLVYAIGLGAVVALSLWWSIHDTSVDPRRAYFVTTTRIWELGLGGLLAVVAPGIERWLREHSRLRAPLAYVGWLAMIAAVATYTGATPFPSWRAAVPVVGAVIVMAADAPLDWYPVRMLQWLGDHSYSLYLWHWPLIQLVPLTHGDHRRGRLDDVVILALALVLAWATARWIERPVRTARRWRPLAPTYALGAGLMVVALVTNLGWRSDLHRHEQALQASIAALAHDPCLGAGYLDRKHHCEATFSATLVRSAAQYADDDTALHWRPGAGPRDCMSSEPDFPLVTCHTVIDAPAKRIALVGNSHGLQWGPALDQIADKRHWRIDTYVAHYCPALLPEGADASRAGCAGWGARVVSTLAQQQPDLVVLSAKAAAGTLRAAGISETSPASVRTGFTRMLQHLAAAGLTVLVVRDIPNPSGESAAGRAPTSCLLAHPDNPTACAQRRSRVVAQDAAVDAARAMHDRHIVTADLTDHFCDRQKCYSYLGGTAVFAGAANHLTATMARTLAPYLLPDVVKGVRAQH
jgi:peptidoglycan/LPS O-acetylase OafA/YrhL